MVAAVGILNVNLCDMETRAPRHARHSTCVTICQLTTLPMVIAHREVESPDGDELKANEHMPQQVVACIEALVL